MNCMDAQYCHWYNWLILLIVDLGPVTVFFIVIIVFHISITSGYANSYILYAQLVSVQISAINIKADWEEILKQSNASNLADVITRPLLSVYSMWNLDLGRSALPNLCLGNNIGSLHAIAFQYFTALYALVLITMVYVLVTLHGRNFRLVVWLWRPFGMCFSHFQRHLDARASIIDAFATFLLLAYSKLALTSIMLLTYTPLFDVSDNIVGYTWLYDGTVEYFGKKHIFLAIIAIVVSVLFIALPPIALVLYPFKCVQKCLTRYRLNRPALVAFMDAFQGCYKDGTNGTRDLRFFSAFYLLLRVLLYALYIGLSRYDLYSWMQYINLLIANVLVVFITVLRPYKKNLYNNIDIAVFAFCICIIGARLYRMTTKHHLLGYQILFYILLAVPFLASFSYVLFRICAFTRVNRCISSCVLKYGSPGIRSTLCHITGSHIRPLGSLDRSSAARSFPDRLLRPEEYEDNGTSELSRACDSYGAL